VLSVRAGAVEQLKPGSIHAGAVVSATKKAGAKRADLPEVALKPMPVHPWSEEESEPNIASVKFH